MKDRIKSAFNQIHADPGLLDETSSFLHEQRCMLVIKKRKPSIRSIAVAAVCLLFFVAGGFSYSVYTTPAAYIDMDVNPSVELVVNRFGRVIQVNDYNDGATALTQATPVLNRSYTEAVGTLLYQMIQDGVLRTDGLVSATVQATSDEGPLLRELEAVIADLLSAHHVTAAIEVYGVSQDVKESAHTHHMSPARYLAISELQEVDDSVSYESCADHSLSQIRRQTEAHGGSGHGAENPEGNGHHHRHGK